MDRPRFCDRPGCGAPASATLTFDYGARQAWLDDLDEPHPTRFELCPRHADRVGVPLGWGFDDRRGRGLIASETAFTREPVRAFSAPEPVSSHPLGDRDVESLQPAFAAGGRAAAS